MPSFRVFETFEIPTRDLFALAGEIVEGTIREGMVVHIPFNSQFGIQERIDSIEFARHTERREDVCLCLHRTAVEREFLRDLNMGEEIIEISDAA
jgi:hypothetical protein